MGQCAIARQCEAERRRRANIALELSGGRSEDAATAFLVNKSAILEAVLTMWQAFVADPVLAVAELTKVSARTAVGFD